MKTLKEHIKKKQFKPVYLLCGSEAYLRRSYRARLKTAVLEGEDDLNYSYFEGKGIEQGEVMDIANTMPFFAEYRLVVVEESGFFKSQNLLSDYIKALPPSTILLFVESEVDKRSKLFKAVKEIGYVCEMNMMKPEELKLFTAASLSKAGKKMTEKNIQFFLETVGSDLFTIQNEIEKLISYTGEREIIEAADVQKISTGQITNKIFDMMDALGDKDKKKALRLYFDLLELKERPMTIIYLVIKHFNRLLVVQEMRNRGALDAEIAAKAGLPTWALHKYIRQSKSFQRAVICGILCRATEIEEQVKTGKLKEQLGVELIIMGLGKD